MHTTALHLHFMIRMFKSAAKFFIVMTVMAVICSMVWGEFVTDRLYNCTDAIGFDYTHPGDWVHSGGTRPVAFVPHVVAGRSMSEPDTIKEGWSVTGLWCLWFSFVVVSLIVSIALARLRWIPKQSEEQIYEHTHAAQPPQD